MSNRLPHAKPSQEVGGGVTDRLLDQIKLWDRVREEAARRKVDSVIILGDLFDKSLVDAITLTATVEALAKMPCKVYILAGNHDAVSTRGERFTVEAFGKMGNDQVEYLETNPERPFQVRDWLNFWPVEYSPMERAKDLIGACRERAKKQSGSNVLLMHQSVLGCTHIGWICDDGLSPEEVCEGFDWVFTGHFHDPQNFGPNKKGLNLGAPMHHRFDDAGRKAGFWYVRFEEDGSAKRVFIDGGCPNFHSIKWPVNSSKLTGMKPGDYVRVVVKCTVSEWESRRPKIEEAARELESKGLHFRFHHQMVHLNAVRELEGEDGEKSVINPTARPEEAIPKYVKSQYVKTGALDKKRLVSLGLELLEEARKNSNDNGFDGGGKLELESVKAEDFCQFPFFEVKLKKRGLVWVGGENQDTTSARSNGSGKTNFFAAICWGLYGKTINGNSGDEIIRAGKKTAKVQISLPGGWKIERSRRKQSPKLQLYLDGAPVPGGRNEIQERINNLVGMDWETFRNVVIYGQGDRRRFIRPETSDDDRKRLLHGILRTSIYSLVHDVVKKRAGSVRKELEKFESEVEKAQARIEEHNPERFRIQAQDWEDDRQERRRAALKKAKELSDKRAALLEKSEGALKIKEEIQSLEGKKEELRRIRKEIKEFDEENRKLERFRSDCVSERARLQERIRAIDGHLSKLNRDKCPTCSTPSSGKDFRNHKEALKNELAELEKKLENVEGKIRQCDDEADAKRKGRRKLVSSQSEIEAELERLPRLNRELAEVRAAKQAAKEAKEQALEVIGRAKAIRDEANPYLVQLRETEEKIGKAQEDKERAHGLVKEKADELAYLEFWVGGFSPSGLPSYVLDSVMPYLTERTNYYLETLADGDITVTFSTQKELKSGEIRDKIGISWVIEGMKDYDPSNGQWKKMELATEFALMDLVTSRSGSTAALLMIDEALDGLDAEGRDRILVILHRLRSTRKSIFVVSHDSDMAEIFERALRITKKEGAAEILEAA